MPRTLVIAGAIELAIIALCILAVFSHAMWLRYKAGPRQARLKKANRLLHRYFEIEFLSMLEMQSLLSLRTNEKVGLFAGISGTFRGRERLLAYQLAVNLGLADVAERKCRSRIWSRRLQGVRLFTLVGGGEAMVLPLFDDPRAEVRAAVAEWAAEHPVPMVIDRLIAMLDDQSTLCRFTVKDSLLRLGSAATQPLVAYLAETESPQQEALEVATWISDPSFMPSAYRFYGHKDPAIRTRLVELIASLGGSNVATLLESTVDDPDADVRAAGLRAMGRLEQWQSAPLLLAGLSDADWDVRKQAGLALSALGAPGTLLLRQSLTSEDPFAADMARHILDTPMTLSDKRGGKS
jgi:hypothetical protein